MLRHRADGLTGLVALLLVAACQPLPHPFADDRPPAALLRIRDVAGVSVAPVDGQPAAVAKKIGPAIAKALLQRDIPASDRTANLDSYQLYGRLTATPQGDGSETVTAQWRLYDAKGHTVGERMAETAAPVEVWKAGGDEPIARLAGLSAERLAPLLEDATPPVSAPVVTADQRRRVAIGTVSGAPGDGDKSLATAVAAVLRRLDLAIVDGGDKPDAQVSADVAVGPGPPGKQHVKIVWHVRRLDGGEVGTVGQENDVPKGLLDGPWGDLAYTIAIAAGDGLTKLVAHAAPPPAKS